MSKERANVVRPIQKYREVTLELARPPPGAAEISEIWRQDSALFYGQHLAILLSAMLGGVPKACTRNGRMLSGQFKNIGRSLPRWRSPVRGATEISEIWRQNSALLYGQHLAILLSAMLGSVPKA